MHIINATERMPPDWGFLRDIYPDDSVKWSTFSGQAASPIERLISRPKLSRYRAARHAALASKSDPASLLISHMPRMSLATSIACRALKSETPHIGFSFNFTDLPTKTAFWRKNLSSLAECVVYSNFERELYAQYFDLPLEKFRFLPWSTERPIPADINPLNIKQPYIAAVGGEARDYALFAKVMTGLPSLPAVVIARSYSTQGITFPDNVQVFHDLPKDQTWRIIGDSIANVIPLRSSETVCGHITMIGTQLTGVPLIVTASVGVSDYVEHETNALTVPAKDADALKHAITRVVDGGAEIGAMAERAQKIAETRNAPQKWVDYVKDAVDRFVPA